MEKAEQAELKITGLLVVIGFVSSFVLWTIDTASSSGETLFALYMSIDLISFAMIAYVYRVTTGGEPVERLWMLVGICLILVMVVAGFVYGGPPY